MEASERFREAQKAAWSAGDWPGFAPTIQGVADAVVAALGVGAGDELLDVATGSGNAALAAAARGARVTGLDFIPALVEAARARAAAAGVEATFVEGDAERLPFPDASFDCVTSIFGAMFAPGHRETARELVRVARPGGTVAVTAWTPEGVNGQMFKVLGSHMPPPEGVEPPVLWGEESHVREIFDLPGVEVTCERRMALIEHPSRDRWIEDLDTKLGPVVVAKSLLEPEGRWEAARADLERLEDSHNQATDGSYRAEAEYLLTTVRREASGAL